LYIFLNNLYFKNNKYIVRGVIMEFSELVEKRFAARAFSEKKIENSELNQILEMIRLSPSAMNLQPWKIKIIDDDNLKEELYQNSWDQKHIKSCSHALLMCANTDLEGQAEKIINGIKASGAPDEMIEFYKMAAKRLTEGTPEKLLCEAQKNVFIATTQGVYAAKSLGIDSCIIQGFDPEAFARILKLPENIVPTVLITLGYALEEPSPKMRFPKEEIML
jgi:nitroreductase